MPRCPLQKEITRAAGPSEHYGFTQQVDARRHMDAAGIAPPVGRQESDFDSDPPALRGQLGKWSVDPACLSCGTSDCLSGLCTGLDRTNLFELHHLLEITKRGAAVIAGTVEVRVSVAEDVEHLAVDSAAGGSTITETGTGISKEPEIKVRPREFPKSPMDQLGSLRSRRTPTDRGGDNAAKATFTNGLRGGQSGKSLSCELCPGGGEPPVTETKCPKEIWLEGQENELLVILQSLLAAVLAAASTGDVVTLSVDLDVEALPECQSHEGASSETSGGPMRHAADRQSNIFTERRRTLSGDRYDNESARPSTKTFEEGKSRRSWLPFRFRVTLLHCVEQESDFEETATVERGTFTVTPYHLANIVQRGLASRTPCAMPDQWAAERRASMKPGMAGHGDTARYKAGQAPGGVGGKEVHQRERLEAIASVIWYCNAIIEERFGGHLGISHSFGSPAKPQASGNLEHIRWSCESASCGRQSEVYLPVEGVGGPSSELSTVRGGARVATNLGLVRGGPQEKLSVYFVVALRQCSSPHGTAGSCDPLRFVKTLRAPMPTSDERPPRIERKRNQDAVPSPPQVQDSAMHSFPWRPKRLPGRDSRQRSEGSLERRGPKRQADAAMPFRDFGKAVGNCAVLYSDTGCPVPLFFFTFEPPLISRAEGDLADSAASGRVSPPPAARSGTSSRTDFSPFSLLPTGFYDEVGPLGDMEAGDQLLRRMVRADEQYRKLWQRSGQTVAVEGAEKTDIRRAASDRKQQFQDLARGQGDANGAAGTSFTAGRRTATRECLLDLALRNTSKNRSRTPVADFFDRRSHKHETDPSVSPRASSHKLGGIHSVSSALEKPEGDVDPTQVMHDIELRAKKHDMPCHHPQRLETPSASPSSAPLCEWKHVTNHRITPVDTAQWTDGGASGTSGGDPPAGKAVLGRTFHASECDPCPSNAAAGKECSSEYQNDGSSSVGDREFAGKIGFLQAAGPTTLVEHETASGASAFRLGDLPALSSSADDEVFSAAAEALFDVSTGIDRGKREGAHFPCTSQDVSDSPRKGVPEREKAVLATLSSTENVEGTGCGRQHQQGCSGKRRETEEREPGTTHGGTTRPCGEPHALTQADADCRPRAGLASGVGRGLSIQPNSNSFVGPPSRCLALAGGPHLDVVDEEQNTWPAAGGFNAEGLPSWETQTRCTRCDPVCRREMCRVRQAKVDQGEAFQATSGDHERHLSKHGPHEASQPTIGDTNERDTRTGGLHVSENDDGYETRLQRPSTFHVYAHAISAPDGEMCAAKHAAGPHRHAERGAEGVRRDTFSDELICVGIKGHDATGTALFHLLPMRRSDAKSCSLQGERLGLSTGHLQTSSAVDPSAAWAHSLEDSYACYVPSFETTHKLPRHESNSDLGYDPNCVWGRTRSDEPREHTRAGLSPREASHVISETGSDELAVLTRDRSVEETGISEVGLRRIAHIPFGARPCLRRENEQLKRGGMLEAAGHTPEDSAHQEAHEAKTQLSHAQCPAGAHLQEETRPESRLGERELPPPRSETAHTGAAPCAQTQTEPVLGSSQVPCKGLCTPLSPDVCCGKPRMVQEGQGAVEANGAPSLAYHSLSLRGQANALPRHPSSGADGQIADAACADIRHGSAPSCSRSPIHARRYLAPLQTEFRHDTNASSRAAPSGDLNQVTDGEHERTWAQLKREQQQLRVQLQRTEGLLEYLAARRQRSDPAEDSEAADKRQLDTSGSDTGNTDLTTDVKNSVQEGVVYDEDDEPHQNDDDECDTASFILTRSLDADGHGKIVLAASRGWPPSRSSCCSSRDSSSALEPCHSLASHLDESTWDRACFRGFSGTEEELFPSARAREEFGLPRGKAFPQPPVVWGRQGAIGANGTPMIVPRRLGAAAAETAQERADPRVFSGAKQPTQLGVYGTPITAVRSVGSRKQYSEGGELCASAVASLWSARNSAGTGEQRREDVRERERGSRAAEIPMGFHGTPMTEPRLARRRGSSGQ
ncbi:hypothetical protein BESB_006930 [Besnoitia besnoiti]|uniref:Uncharacterized protein n=1 Tax=Besnoitia besnoiti TaxID=94643 RepID=A0A2A9MQN0_BESBE|nr:hypothetical protein BESB_006930 [Besnoitia besnoiti]PFH38352.1 hypothetical protein BESB_006930 [Besnoitia besnoiti]